MVCMPARKEIAKKGKARHEWAMITDAIAVLRSERNAIGLATSPRSSRAHPRQQQEGAEEGPAADLLVQHEGHRHSEHELDRDRADGEHEGVDQRGAELRPREDVAEVLQTKASQIA
jgi:hypothetical protein